MKDEVVYHAFIRFHILLFVCLLAFAVSCQSVDYHPSIGSALVLQSVSLHR